MAKLNRLIPNSNFKRLLLFLLLLVLIFGILELSNAIDVIHSKNAPTAGPATKGEPKSPQTTTNDPSDDALPVSEQNSDKKSNNPPANINLRTPSGIFVSTHHLSYSGQKGVNISSSCNTSPGATCYIQFTKGGIIKSLPKQKTDAEGSTYWDWTLHKIGINQGVWQVRAVATYNNQSKTARDPLNLEVGP